MSDIESCGIVRRLQIGESMPFAREQTSAINKFSVDKVLVTSTGFVGDEQADQFFHGGPIQAIHQMPERVCDLIKQQFPTIVIYEGMLGENLIVSGMQESSVCIGDIFQIGSVQMQVTRPRRPCWKIDTQLNQRGVAKFLQDEGCVGWYYRIIKTGEMALNDNCHLISREYSFATLTRLWQIYNDKNFRDSDEIQHWLAIEVLERSFKDVLRKRLT
jgi:MOSC domain-containing protein YiiM